jgi:hypothetical protein
VANRAAKTSTTAKVVKAIPTAPTYLPTRTASAASRIKLMLSLTADFTGCSRPEPGHNQDNVIRTIAPGKRGHSQPARRMHWNTVRISSGDDPRMEKLTG